MIDNLINRTFRFFDDYLKGKNITPIIRSIVDPLLTLNITSYLFERFYFKYEWLDITDYKSILNFIIKGDAIVPISLFIVVHVFFLFATKFLFKKLNQKILSYIKNKYKIAKEDTLSLYLPVKKLLEDKHINQLLSKMRKNKNEIEKNYFFIFKLIVVNIFFFFILPNYGFLLFIATLIILLPWLFANWILFLIADFIPSVVARLKMIGEKELRKKEDGTKNETAIS